ncbi:MAG: hypothetical protein M5U12_33440 [Verrucomicrobia bacterium]|nr:hypothetical protein [Verrucomicrobiota bacterium]
MRLDRPGAAGPESPMNDRRLAFIYAPQIEGLSYPPDCPFKTERSTLTRRRLLSFGWLGLPHRAEITARPATRVELGRLHSDRYLLELERATAGDLTPKVCTWVWAGRTHRCSRTSCPTPPGPVAPR